MENGWEAFGQLVRYFGVPGAIFLAMLWGYHKGWFITGREAAERKAQEEEREADARRIAEERQVEWVKRWDELTKEKDMWRGAFLDSVKVAERAVRTAEVTAERLPNSKKAEGLPT